MTVADQLVDAEHARDMAGAELADAEDALFAAKRRRQEAEHRYVEACKAVADVAAAGINEWKASNTAEQVGFTP